MSVKIGDNGEIKIAPESTYGTAGTVYVAQHPRAASLGKRQNLIPPATLGNQNYAVRKFGVPFSDGEIILAYDDSRAVIGGALAMLGNLATNDYTIGDGSAPDQKGSTIWVDYGGFVIRYVGCVATSARWEFSPDSPVILTMGFLGQSSSKETPTAIVKPDEAGIVYESDISAITIAGAAMCSLSGTIEATFPVVGSDRHCLGSGIIKEPQYAGRTMLTVNLNTELADDTGADSEAVLDLFLAGTTLGDIVIGDFVLSNCYMTGDPPALGEGITQLPINAEGKELVITTTA